MPYVFDLEEDLARVPLTEADGTYSINFVLGYEFDPDSLVLMSVLLIPDSGIFELCFGIRKYPPGGDVWPPLEIDYSRETAAQYVPASATYDVLAYVGVALIYLLQVVRPEFVVMETFHPNLPEKAMQKYRRIEEVFAHFGYAIDSYRDTEDGKDYWIFSK